MTTDTGTADGTKPESRDGYSCDELKALLEGARRSPAFFDYDGWEYAVVDADFLHALLQHAGPEMLNDPDEEEDSHDIVFLKGAGS